MSHTIDTTEIRYSRETKDFDLYDDGRYIGSAATFHEVEQKRTAYLAERRELEYTATELDGAQAEDGCPSCGNQREHERPGLCGTCQDAGLMLMPEGDILDTDGMRVKATAQAHDDSDDTEVNRNSRARAYTAIYQTIELVLSQNKQCPNCAGAHFGWQCPDIHAALFWPETTPARHNIALGRELCRMKWHNFRGFVALLLSVLAAHLVIYAASYQAFIRANRPDSDMTIAQVLDAWANDMRRGGDRGPSAMALKRAA